MSECNDQTNDKSDPIMDECNDQPIDKSNLSDMILNECDDHWHTGKSAAELVSGGIKIQQKVVPKASQIPT